MEENYKKKGHIVAGIALLQMIAALAILVFGTINKSITVVQSNVLMCGTLVIYWILMDVVEPRVAHRLDDIASFQKSAYLKYIFFDLLGYAGIAYFLLGMGSSQNNSLYGALVYAIAMKFKRDNQDIFLGKTVPGQETEETDEEETDEEVIGESAAIEQNEKE